MTSKAKQAGRLPSIALRLFLLAVFGGAFLLNPGLQGAGRSAIAAGEMSQSEFDQRVHNYILAHPEVLVEALQSLDARQRAADAAATKAALSKRADDLFRDKESPVGGNAQGDVTVVEFFDYNCPYCRQVAPVMIKAEEDDPQLRIVYKEFPILGPNSMFAAKAGLAARRQNLYPQFHKAMMLVSGSADEARVVAVAEEIGLNVEQLRADMQNPAIDAEIGRNLALARALRINGTPGFVIGDEILRGATDLQTMQRLVAKARQGAGQ